MSTSQQGSNRKSRLAVFEQLAPREDKRNRHRSPDPSSECDLVIDDDEYQAPPKKRARGVRSVEEPLKLQCEWEECYQLFVDYKPYMEHVNGHVLNLEDKEIKGGIPCLWKDCGAILPVLIDIIKHVSFHGYHSKLKNIGENMLERVKLPKCLKTEQYNVPAEIENYNCDWKGCDRYFITVNDFYQHIKIHVNSNPKYCKDGEIIECAWKGCTQKCQSQYKLADHMRTHTKERMIACPACGTMFATKTKFCDHRKRQLPLEMQSYQCSQCSKLFPTERLLRDHMRSHINHYKCGLCDMTCPKPSILAKHIMFRHLNERPFKCNLCEHSCVSKYHLDQHLTTHCAEKLMACEECDFRCRSMYGLDRHYQKEHGSSSQTYECHCCHERYARGHYLTRHLIKKHDYHWPSGHSRFRYKEDSDGIYRLQTVRYESLEVTQEMMQSTSQPSMPATVKYNLRQEKSTASKLPSYVLMTSETGEESVVCATDNNVVITIADVDSRGKVVRSETIESQEIVCVPDDARFNRQLKRECKIECDG